MKSDLNAFSARIRVITATNLILGFGCTSTDMKSGLGAFSARTNALTTTNLILRFGHG